jgi:pyroglutamyl-peptidase
MNRILVTGFEPFGAHHENVSATVTTRLQAPAGCELRSTVLPVSFDAVWHPVATALQEFQPDVVLALGLAEDRSVITPELVAINYMDARIPDNRGRQPKQVPILDDGPPAYFSTLPVHAMAENLCRAGHRASVSYSAGAFVCNYLMYRVLHYLAGAGPETAPGAPAAAASPLRIPCAGFVHLPGSAPAGDVDALIEATHVILGTVCGAGAPQKNPAQRSGVS